MPDSAVSQMRVAVTAEDFDVAVPFYRDVLGLAVEAEYTTDRGRVVIFDAGRATLELSDPPHAEYIDEVEVGRRVAGHIRIAFEVADATTTTARLKDAGAQVIAEPTKTPWNSLNSRLQGPADLQLTLFEELG